MNRLFAVALCGAFAQAEQSHVITLTDENFDKMIKSHPYDNHWFVKFYATWDHHSKDLAPTWENFAELWADKVNVGEVNCTEQWNLCKRMKIKGYPSLYFFALGEPLEHFYDYHGARMIDDFVHYSVWEEYKG